MKVLRDTLGRLFLPHYCQFCQASTLGGRLRTVCRACEQKIPAPAASSCAICDEEFSAKLGPDVACLNCEGQTFSFEKNRSALRVGQEAVAMVHALKYQRQTIFSRDFAALLEPLVEQLMKQEKAVSGWRLVPVPLHRRRLGSRGFNQAERIASFLSKRTGVPLANSLKRTRYTTTQTALDRKQRQANLKGAFALRRRTRLPEGCGVFLIDDVFTTGSTADACSEVLMRDSGAQKVIVLTAMRG